MPARSGVARGVAALALATTLVGSAAPAAFAAEPAAAVSVEKKKDPEESPVNPSSVTNLLNVPGASSTSKGKGDLADTILSGIHFAADAADLVVPIVVDLVDDDH